jgi:hypothetical protein
VLTLTDKLTPVYLSLPESDDTQWPTLLRKKAAPFMDDVLKQVGAVG